MTFISALAKTVWAARVDVILPKLEDWRIHMGPQRRTYARETPEQRRRDLINATLEIIGETGFQSATVRLIADRADVTLGLIRHYFSTKEELISAAYQYHMEQMTSLALAPELAAGATNRQRLIAVIRANLTPPVLTERNVTLWANFVAQIANISEIRATHGRTYLQFRNGLETLISNALKEAGREVSSKEARSLATISNAIIDGLWLEGGAAPRVFETGELAALALRSIGTVLQLDLSEEKGET